MPHDRPRARKIKPGSFASVIRDYMKSDAFMRLTRATRENYSRELELAERPEILGEYPAAEMRPALVQGFLDGLAHSPGKQKIAKTAISALQKWALIRDRLLFPITTGTEVVGSDGGHVPWSDDQVALGEQHASPILSRLITLAANTGQRGSDLVKMRWSDIEEHGGRIGINVHQKKTGLRIWIPFTTEFQGAVMGWDRQPTFLVLNTDGTQLTRPEVSNRWMRERAHNPSLAPLAEAGLVMHGLRGTAVVRLRRGGASVPQICDMVGMSEQMVARYCRFSNQRDNALAAVHYLDRTALERMSKSLKSKSATI